MRGKMNTPTVITVIILVAAVTAAIIVIIRRKKQGKTYCSGGCSGCPMSGSCHKEKENR